MGRRFKKISLVILVFSLLGFVVPEKVGAESAEIITITDSTSTLHVGMSYTFCAENSGDVGEIIWSVSNSNYASIDSTSGVFTAKKKGTVTVTAEDGSMNVSVIVKIIGNTVSIKKKETAKSYKNSQGKAVMTLSYHYPVLSGKYKGLEKINKYFVREKNKWFKSQSGNIQSAKEESTRDSFYPYGDEVTYRITYNKNNIICILQEGYLFTGGAHGMPYRIVSTFNLKTGKEVPLTTLLNKNSKTIKKQVIVAFKKIINKSPDEYWEDALNTVSNTKLSNMNYYLTDNGILCYFAPYDLASYARGYVEATIPFK